MTYNITPQQRNQGQINKLVLLAGSLLVITLLWNVVGLFGQYVTRRRLLAEEMAQKVQLENEQKNLNYRAKLAQTDTYIEERARQIGLTKEGEYVVIAQYPHPSPTPQPEKPQIKLTYRAWIQVFSHP
ncbi:MAG: septum formation initiator family protein [Patescibacteria group bacterium]|jgi:cell division protein FtsB